MTPDQLRCRITRTDIFFGTQKNDIEFWKEQKYERHCGRKTERYALYESFVCSTKVEHNEGYPNNQRTVPKNQEEN